MQSESGKPTYPIAELPASPTPDAEAVIRRMKEALELRTDNDLAGALGVSKGTVSSWRKRNAIPYDECVRVAYYTRTHLEWILSGREGEMYPGLLESGINVKLMETIVYGIVKSNAFYSIADKWDRASLMARTIIVDYSRYLEMMSEATKLGKMTNDEYLGALRRAMEKSSVIDDDKE